MLMLNQNAPSHPERVIMAYYHLANARPDLATFASLSPFLDNAQDADIPHIIQREYNRLEQVYAGFDSDEPLFVHTRLSLNNYSTLREVLNLAEFTPQTFFQYSLYGEDVAIVPKDINRFHEIPMPKDRMEDMLSQANSTNIQAELLLKPIHADTNTPFNYNNKSYKLMLADIAEIRFWTTSRGDPKLLWTYRADWYVPKMSADLMKLKPVIGQN